MFAICALGLGGLSSVQPFKPRQQIPGGSVPRRVRVEDDATPERVRRGDLANYQPITGGRNHRLLEPDLPETAAEPGETCGTLARAVMNLDAVAVLR